MAGFFFDRPNIDFSGKVPLYKCRFCGRGVPFSELETNVPESESNREFICASCYAEAMEEV